MKKTLINTNTLLLIASFLVFTVSLTTHMGAKRVDAQNIFATLIGGTTGGINFVCCNGFVLDFGSVDSLNPNILQGQALWVPGFTQTYDHTREFLPGFCTVGTLIPGFCLTVASECTVPTPMPMIKEIGTGGAICF